MLLSEIKFKIQVIDSKLSDLDKSGSESVKSQDYGRVKEINEQKDILYKELRELQLLFLDMSRDQTTESEIKTWLIDFFEKKKTRL